MQSLKSENTYDYISDVELQHDQVYNISQGCSCKGDLAVSECLSGWPHVTVTTVKSDRAGS